MPISEKLAKVIALWRGAATEGERQAARARGEALAAKAGLTFDQAAKEQIAATSGGNPFAGFDDWMEAKEPGYKAQQAKMRAEREQARRARCAALVERYGSEEAALAPCERERILLDAVAKWRKPRDAPYERWTDSLDGWCSDYAAAPPHVAEAIRNSYPFPQTFAAAQAELDYWRQRDRDMRDILDSDYGLDLVADCRSRMVEKAIESDLR